LPERAVASDDKDTGQERTEQASPRRREEFRRRGRVALSPDLTAAAGLLAGLGMLTLTAATLTTDAVEMLGRHLTALPRADLTIDGALGLALDALLAAFRLGWPLVLGPMLVGLAVHGLQTRGVVSAEGLRLRWSRLSPATNLGRLFSGRSAAALIKALLKLLIVGWVAVATLRTDWPQLLGASVDGRAHLAAVGAAVGRVWLRIAGGYLLLALLDYAYQWWEHEKSLRMTKEEVRRETRETEPSPTLRQRLRTLHQKMASRRMMADVARADVVVRNPTHVAVALRYQAGRMRAPRVVAKGERLLALRIIEVARAARVPVVENRPLARALFASVDIGRDVPPTLYRAVAEVLAYVYSLAGGRC
jgi:flagellar biosynthetic protein FlhB